MDGCACWANGKEVRAAGFGVPRIVGMAAAGFAVAIGLGRFSFTPILPLMTGQAGLSAAAGAHLATANYLGYLAGPVLTLLLPRLVSSRILYRCSLVLIVVSLLGMGLTTNELIWLDLRFPAGAASALLFVMIASSTAYHCRAADRHVIGWAYGGIGGRYRPLRNPDPCPRPRRRLAARMVGRGTGFPGAGRAGMAPTPSSDHQKLADADTPSTGSKPPSGCGIVSSRASLPGGQLLPYRDNPPNPSPLTTSIPYCCRLGRHSNGLEAGTAA
jgi:hypothetical protein